MHADEYENITDQIKKLLALKPLPLKALIDAVTEHREDKIIHTIQWLLDNDELKYDRKSLLSLPSI